ncbi:hypothetical protein EUGRSUZ_F01869 [Eucalyptus grandis]|uniref:Uncharacterized protein n=2 Tax=Eucalyptus grandis TaxID=71139 RepID=A0ACC3KGF3_EUCGR|nr:hypothetical protein EUGRSUZ_F01869 [Eucalyptus grandis]
MMIAHHGPNVHGKKKKKKILKLHYHQEGKKSMDQTWSMLKWWLFQNDQICSRYDGGGENLDDELKPSKRR